MRVRRHGDEAPTTMTPVEPLSFPGAGGARLSGALHVPTGLPAGSVLLAHCFTCSKSLHTMTRLAQALADGGYAAFRFDFTGLGDSEGDFASTTLATNVGDLSLAAVALIKRGYGPCSLVGHSLGGAAVLLAAHRLKTVRSVVVIGAPSSPAHVRQLLVDDEAEIRRRGIADVAIGGRRFSISAAFLDDLATHHQERRVSELGRPLLVIHAVDDEVVPVTEGEAIFAAARQPKAFLPVIGADHLLTDPASAEFVARSVVGWLDATR